MRKKRLAEKNHSREPRWFEVIRCSSQDFQDTRSTRACTRPRFHYPLHGIRRLIWREEPNSETQEPPFFVLPLLPGRSLRMSRQDPQDENLGLNSRFLTTAGVSRMIRKLRRNRKAEPISAEPNACRKSKKKKLGEHGQMPYARIIYLSASGARGSIANALASRQSAGRLEGQAIRKRPAATGCRRQAGRGVWLPR